MDELKTKISVPIQPEGDDNIFILPNFVIERLADFFLPKLRENMEKETK